LITKEKKKLDLHTFFHTKIEKNIHFLNNDEIFSQSIAKEKEELELHTFFYTKIEKTYRCKIIQKTYFFQQQQQQHPVKFSEYFYERRSDHEIVDRIKAILKCKK